MRKYCINKVCAMALWFGAGAWCFGQVNFTRGEDLLMRNKPKEAVVYLENAIADDPANARAFLYLGIVYEQLDRTGEAIAAYRKILDRAGDLSAHVANNLGNAYFKQGNFAEAEQCYTLALADDPSYASAYLGRANTRVKAGSLRAALDDYDLYLILEPASSKRAVIERLLSFIRSEFASEERRKLLAEEQARVEAEQARVEAEKRQRLLNEVTASLQSAADASQGLSSGAENVEGYEGAFELE